MINLITCWNCKKEIEVEEKPTRKDECPHCSSPIKACFNCLHYDKDVFHQCKESAVAEWVRYKEKANFCEYFTPRFLHLLKKQTPATKEDRKEAWDSLFED